MRINSLDARLEFGLHTGRVEGTRKKSGYFGWLLEMQDYAQCAGVAAFYCETFFSIIGSPHAGGQNSGKGVANLLRNFAPDRYVLCPAVSTIILDLDNPQSSATSRLEGENIDGL